MADKSLLPADDPLSSEPSEETLARFAAGKEAAEAAWAAGGEVPTESEAPAPEHQQDVTQATTEGQDPFAPAEVNQ